MRWILPFLFSTLPALSQGIASAEYSRLAKELNARSDFETLPQRPEPGFVFDAPYRSEGVWLAERFEGQKIVNATLFDVLSGEPVNPLKIRKGKAGRNLSVAFHKGFGSNALFPLGPDGFPEISARGEGAVAIMFDNDQYALGFRVHSDYPAPLGQRPGQRGTATVRFFTRNGTKIDQQTLTLQQGITEFGFERENYISDIAGITITNDDPGGIAIDDIIFQIYLPLS